MADDPKNSPEESETIRALRNKYPDLAEGETVATPDDQPLSETALSREAAMGIPQDRLGRTMVPDNPDDAASLPPVMDGFFNEPIFDPTTMNREEYDAYRANLKPSTEPQPLPQPQPPQPQPPQPPPPPSPPSEEFIVSPEAPPVKHQPPSQAASAQPPSQAASAPTFAAAPRTSNPILDKLKRNLGIANSVLETVEINDMPFILRLASPRLKSYATTAPSVMSDTTDLSWSFYFNCSLAAIFVVGIEGTPLFQVLGVDPSAEEYGDMQRKGNFFDPPYSLVIRTVPVFFDMMLDSLRDGLAAKIVEKYNEKFDKYSEVLAFDDVGNEGFRYQCTKVDCDETFTSEYDGNFFCRLHGSPMGPQKEVEESKVPLASEPQ